LAVLKLIFLAMQKPAFLLQKLTFLWKSWFDPQKLVLLRKPVLAS